MNVVLYMRYSSDRQSEQSIEGQERVCREYCKRNGYTIVGRYIDRALSASKDTEKRLEFQRMIRDSEKGTFAAVVVYKLDRFARNRYDSATFKARLKKNGVRLISATEPISEEPEGVILEAVLEGMAEYYSKELSQKITRGMRESAFKCQAVGGHIPLGYKIVDRHYVIDEPAAMIVREAFDLYASGKTIDQICELFNAKGYRSSTGSAFNKNSFRKMFCNERYVGVYSYQEIRVEDGMPAIVDKETFQRVQKRVKENKAAPGRGKAKVDYLLAQKLFCGHCGHTMIGESGVSEYGSTYNYYTCSHRRRRHACDKRPVKKEWIEHAVAEEVKGLLTPELIDEMAEMAIAQNAADMEADTVVPALNDRLKEIDKAIRNLLRLAEKCEETDSIFRRLDELEKEKRLTERQLEEAKAAYIVLDKDHVVWWLSRFCDGSIEDEDFRRHLIDLLVNSVTVWDEPDGWYKMTIVFNLTNERQKTLRIVPPGGSSVLASYIPPKMTVTLLCGRHF